MLRHLILKTNESFQKAAANARASVNMNEEMKKNFKKVAAFVLYCYIIQIYDRSGFKKVHDL